VAIYNISFIGAGNVAESLSAGLAAAGHRIVSVASKSGASARLLADSMGAEWRHDLSLPDNCEIVILAVNDNVVASLASEITLPEGAIIVHTAGSVPLSALGREVSAGVLYPLQTFTRGFSPNLGRVPFFVEAADILTLKILKELGNNIGAGAWECDSRQRMYLHVAAVFTNNFSNFMMTTGETIAAEAGIDPELLRPLMEETVRKALRTGPAASQTGPAVRHDTNTLKSHLELLSFSPEYQKLYRLVSEMIAGHYKNSAR
jgi:predicted short-subunit dehydrogenase-like oxidoreductase (DUF2520 family)